MTVQRKSMKTEAKKSYDCGFALAEGELRRLHDTLLRQLKSAPTVDGLETNYEVKYRNGSVAYPSSLDEVLEQENFGSAAIVRLKMQASDRIEGPANQISVEFTNAEEDEQESIRYRVTGDDRDWVFVTSSQLDERIGKIKLFSPNQLFFGKFRFWVSVLPLGILMLATLLTISLSSHRRHTRSLSQLNAISLEWKTGTLKDPGVLMIDVGRVIIDGSQASETLPIWIPFAMVFAIFALPLLGYCYAYFQPPYNFLWGDYVPIYEKRRSRGRFVLVGIIFAVILGIVINFISKKIGI